LCLGCFPDFDFVLIDLSASLFWNAFLICDVRTGQWEHQPDGNGGEGMNGTKLRGSFGFIILH